MYIYIYTKREEEENIVLYRQLRQSVDIPGFFLFKLFFFSLIFFCLKKIAMPMYVSSLKS